MVKRQKYHILYKTTCKASGNFYIGAHSTTNLEDNYLGSGLHLSRSINKHGKENHVREILDTFSSREELMKREREVVNEDLLKEEKCMNLKRGGEGGLHLVNKDKQKKIHEGSSKWIRKQWKNPEYRKNMIISIKKTNQKRLIEGTLIPSNFNFLGRKHTEKTLERLKNKKTQVGEKNSQFGKVWIFKETENKSIHNSLLEEYLLMGWKKGRNIKKITR